MIKARFLPTAELELLKEVAYYSKARVGLGIRFQAEVEATVARVVANPLSGRPTTKGTRSRIVKDFPFDVVYVTQCPTSFDYRVLHCLPSDSESLSSWSGRTGWQQSVRCTFTLLGQENQQDDDAN